MLNVNLDSIMIGRNYLREHGIDVGYGFAENDALLLHMRSSRFSDNSDPEHVVSLPIEVFSVYEFLKSEGHEVDIGFEGDDLVFRVQRAPRFAA